MKNYRTLILFFSLSLLLFSCKKEDDPQEQEEHNQGIGVGEIINETAPTSFTKKVLIEEFTGEWCGYCPDGAARITQIKQNHPDLVYAISYHDNDPFANSVCTLYEGLLNTPFFPSAAIDRVPYQGDLSFSRSHWAQVTNTRLNETAKMGLKLETTLNGNVLKVDAKFSGTEDNNEVYLTLALIEDDVPESSPGAQSGAPAGYVHHDVFREMITRNRGELTSIEANKVKLATYDNIDVSAYDKNNLYIVALLHEKTDNNTKEVFNVQSVKAGENKDFD